MGYSVSVEISGRVSENNTATGDSHPTQTVQASSPSLLGYSGRGFKTKGSSRALIEGGGSMTGNKLNETVSRKAFALQDKVSLFKRPPNTKLVSFFRSVTCFKSKKADISSPT